MADVRRLPLEAGGRAAAAEAAVGSRTDERRNPAVDDVPVPAFAGARTDPRRGNAPPVPSAFSTERRRLLGKPAVEDGVETGVSRVLRGRKRELRRGAIMLAMLMEPRREGFISLLACWYFCTCGVYFNERGTTFK